MIAADMDRIIAGTAADCSGKLIACAEYINTIGSAAAVNLDGLDIAERNNPPRTGNDIVRDNKRITDRRANDYQCIDTRPAVDLYGAVLEVAVTVVALPAEQPGQVGDLIRIIHILPEDKERLEQKSVVTAAAVQIKLCTVVVDLEPVVLVLAHYKHHIRVSVGQVLGIYYRYTFWILECAISGIWFKRYGSNNNLIIARTEVYYHNGGCVVGEHKVVAA